MKLDFISIFPEFFEPLKLSLIGKARDKSLIEISVHDLRDHAINVHRQIDDTPYGGGAGMVMMPEVWGKAIDPVITKDSELIILTPAGKRFDQRMAEELSTKPHLIFACGRYEGIDDRVRQYYLSAGFKVREVSIGDYVLNGGEVAAIVIAEAVSRLIPGVLGNPESIIDESHAEEGYIEYPAFTKPAEWRGLKVPDVLLSGNHAEIARWRKAAGINRANHNS
ncbi:MAG: tRNA (guanosine(37)-N1)-methyltransferase TrmD [Candidatus Nanopelagicaceae bacterium]